MNDVLVKVAKYNVKLPAMAYYRVRDKFFRKPLKNIALIGWLGAYNLGDEIMLDTTLDYMKPKFNNITLLTCGPRMTNIEKYQGYTIVPRAPLTDKAIEFTVKNNDIFWVNGGALLDDRYYDNDDTTLARDIARLAIAFLDAKKQVVVYGVSCNESFGNKNFIRDYARIINESDYFSVRDNISRKSLNKLAGITDKNKIKLVDDIAFANPSIKKTVYSEDDTNSLGFIPVMNNNVDLYSDIIEKIMESTNKNIKYILFCDEWSHELNTLIEIKRRLGLKTNNLDNIICPTNIDEFIAALDQVDILVSARYHGTLIANCVGKPTVCLHLDNHPHYKNKNTYLYKTYGFNDTRLSVSSLTIAKIKSAIKRAETSNVDVAKIYNRAKHDLLSVINSVSRP